MAAKKAPSPKALAMAERAARLRSVAKLSQGQVEQASNGAVGRSWLSRFEKGAYEDPGYQVISALARVLGTTAAYLVTGERDPEVPSEEAEAILAEIRDWSKSQREAAVRVVQALPEGHRRRLGLRERAAEERRAAKDRPVVAQR